MKGYVIIVVALAIYAVSMWHLLSPPAMQPKTYSAQKEQKARITTPPTPIQVPVKTPPEMYTLAPSRFVGQSFNNCGPASLSMVMSMYGVYKTQDELREQMRPFSNPFGGVDDKSIFASEFVAHAQKNGFLALHRPNGTVDLLKTLVANDIPVVMRTWLNLNEDIGHFRIVRGYDDSRQVFIQDDSYQGPNLEFSYADFMTMWQPFNYGYILVYPEEKKDIVDAILREEIQEETAYQNSIVRAEEELKKNPNDMYAQFNLASAYYYLGEYESSVAAFEKAEQSLPQQMLWYQVEPIYAYAKLNNSERVMTLTDSILYTGNLAYSELYQVRGDVLSAQGNKEAARAEYEKAVYYNQFFEPAQEALKTL